MSRYVVQVTWDDVPHLGEKEKVEMLSSLPPHQRDARSKGVPSLGAGAIYPISEEDIVCEPFAIPDYWPRLYGLDVGWKRTAGIWGAWDRDTDTLYLYSEHYRGQAEPSVHASAIKMRGKWIPGVIDTAAHGRSQIDGTSLYDLYEAEGLMLNNANKAVEAGIAALYQRMSTGQLKVFSTLQNWLSEFRLYRRNDKGLIVKENDHLMDATRYLNMGLIDYAATKPVERAVVYSSRGDRTAGY